MFLFAGLPTTAQETETPQDDLRNHPRQIFLQRDIDDTGLDRLIFVDMVTGENTELEVYGERYTPLNRSVMYFDYASRRVMLALPDGTTEDHPFIQLGTADRRVDWVVSNNRSKIAWTTNQQDAQGMFTTRTTIANADGSEQRLILEDGPREDIRALPLAFSDDLNTLYLDIAHIDGISNFTPFNLYAGIVALNLETSEVSPLPDEQPANCLCGADFRRGLFARLRLSADGFDLHIYNLPGRFDYVIPAYNLRNYTSAASILISPDTRYAIYALARVNNFGGADQSIQTVFMLADLESRTQQALTNPITTFVIPVEWTEDDTAVIFTSPLTNGTWKISLGEGRLERIADSTYIGRLP